jgi:hypothetical protein
MHLFGRILTVFTHGDIPEQSGGTMNRNAKADLTAAYTDLIRATERKRLRALVDADMEVAIPLHAADFQLVTPAGATFSKEQYMDAIASGTLDYRKWEPESEIAVHLYDRGAAIRYQSQIEVIASGIQTSARAWHTDLCEEREGRWQIVWSQATIIRG